MTWAETLRIALAAFGLPCMHGEYEGEAPEYFVFSAIVLPDNYADDEPQHERVLIMLHYFSPTDKNTMQMRKEIKLAVQQAGFSYPIEQDASENGKQHFVFEFETAQGV